MLDSRTAGDRHVSVIEAPATAIDYDECRYGRSRMRFRGPKRSLTGDYVAAIGGSQTFGKFVSVPFVDALEAQIDMPVVNLGAMQAGLTLIADDPDILSVASGARVTIVQILGAQNMSNRFYSVHPRRNDRFVGASQALKQLFPKTDFTEFHFVGHLVSTLAAVGGEPFELLVRELQTAWINRMRLILRATGSKTMLLWMADRAPDEAFDLTNPLDPHFVTREMLDDVAKDAGQVVEAVPGMTARLEGLAGKEFLPHEEHAAAAMPGPLFHSQVATRLADLLGKLNKKNAPARPARF